MAATIISFGKPVEKVTQNPTKPIEERVHIL